MSADHDPLHEGDRFGRYQLRERLGAGGMGVVYRALDVQTDTLVALKVLTDPHPAAATRFDREARLQARADHPQVARLIETATHHGRRYIAMEYVGGVTLAQYIAHRGRLQAAEAVVLFDRVAEAVVHLHGCRVAHGDLKSDNIKVLPDGRPRLLDFGIARDLATPAGAGEDEVAGSVHCLAPEVLDGAAAGVRSDVWALGVLLYEMCTGVLPFDGTTLAQVAGQVRRAAPVPAAQRVAGLPPAVVAVIDGCLQRDPARRWSSVAAMRAALQGEGDRAQGLAAVPARVRVALGGPWPWSSWTWRLALPVVLVTAALLGGGVVAGGWWASAPVWWRFPPEADVVTMQARGAPPQAEVRIDALGGQAELWAGEALVGRTPFTARAPIGARVALRLRWGEGLGERDIGFEVREMASDNAYTYRPPGP